MKLPFLKNWKSTKNEKGNTMKIGDYVKVKDGIELDNGELSKGWAGKILDIEDEFVTIQKDAKTLNSLSDNYIKHGFDNGLDEHNYVFEKEDLKLSKRRDTDKEYKAAVEHLWKRYEELDDDYREDSDAEEAYTNVMETISQNFFKSSFAEKIADIEASDASFIIEIFVDYAMQYRGEMMKDWTKKTIDEICLDVLPRKVSMEVEKFEVIGKVLKHFFDFLVAENFIKNKALGNYVYSKRAIIHKNAENPANWGIAKTMMMNAAEQDVDLDDTDALKSFMNAQMFKPMDLPESYINHYQEPAEKEKLKKIGRNDKVSVKYTDGKILKDVKFKKVMKDVASGKCELI